MGWTLRKRIVAVVGAAAAAGAMSLVAAAGPAGATDFGPVDPTIPDGNTNSLRDILQNQVGAGDLVILQAGATYTLASSGGDIDIKAGLVTIQGNGATIRQTVPDNRVLDTDFELTLQNVTITGGREDSDGGGVREDSTNRTLTIEGSTLTDNATVDGDDGGAIEADGPLVIRNSTVSNNSASGDGGAFSNDGAASISRSTFVGNCSEDDGGVVDGDNDVKLVNSTVTGNTSDEDGAIDMDDGDLTLVYSDVVDNTHDAGVDCPNTTAVAAAGAPEDPPEADDAPEPDDVAALDTDESANIEISDNSFFVFGSVVALPRNASGETGTPFNCEDLPTAGTTSSGFNFSDDDTCGFTNTAQGDRESAGDPGLAALANNGGPTQTRLPQPGSPLVNFIPIPDCGGGDDLAGFAVTTDQRGVSRPQETGCEIGSVEIEPPPPPPPGPAQAGAAPAAAVPVEPRFTG
jgi:hypothetical protein